MQADGKGGCQRGVKEAAPFFDIKDEKDRYGFKEESRCLKELDALGSTYR